MTVTIRSATIDDSPAFVELRREINPWSVFTVAAMRHIWETEPARARALRLVAEKDGEPIAVGRASLNTFTSTPGTAIFGILVRASERGQGIGGRLHDLLTEHLREVGATRFEGWGDGDEHTARFLAGRGFVQRHQLRYSHLDLTTPLPPLPAIPDGVRCVPFAEATPEDVFAVDAESALDEPGDTPADGMDFTEWLDHVWHSPAVDLTASMLVYADGVPAANTTVEVDAEGRRIWSGGTGSRRDYRGRGFAKLAKSVALRKAAEDGMTDAYTTNDETNKPMLAINEWLGYRPCATQFSYLREG
ncbi:MAG: GNAT family N-acetyltransferase [Hamadaea sp.]|nr:GNAT family N-acetyltransferase [Hamadaea sp.]